MKTSDARNKSMSKMEPFLHQRQSTDIFQEGGKDKPNYVKSQSYANIKNHLKSTRDASPLGRTQINDIMRSIDLVDVHVAYDDVKLERVGSQRRIVEKNITVNLEDR